jgi:Bacterial Ig-like domain (group 3)/Abnormal spindle-like microcephaly-assoc'd, ASPM-SPD-2-Hydin
VQYVATRRQPPTRARLALWLVLPVAAMCAALGLCAPSAQAANACTGTALTGSPFTAAGTATVPANAVALCVYARGGSGANGGGSASFGLGGAGAEQTSYYLVGGSSRFAPDLGLTVLVGGGGIRPSGGTGGGGRAGGTAQGAGSPSLAGGGGGRSSVAPQTGDTSEIVVAAGGGGGASGASGQQGGNGGKWGQPGASGNANAGSGGGAGTQSSGGAGGTGISAGNGAAGTSGVGGNAGVQNTGRGGGGGGGGYYGGGGGGGGGNGGATPTSRGGGGGGGSNFHDTTGLMSLTGNPSVADGPTAGTTPGAAGVAGAVAISYYTALSGLDLTASANPAAPGETVTYTAFLDPGASGSVVFKEGSTELCTSSILLGVASCEATAGSIGSYAITASYAGDSTYAPGEDTVDLVVADTGPAVSFTVSALGSATAGSPVDLTVTAKDAGGDTATGYSGTVAFTSTDGDASLPSEYTFTGADNGSHTFTDVTLVTAGSQTVTATDTVTSSIAGTSGSITVDPAGASTLIVSAPSSAVAGSAFDTTVTARDAFGNTATGYSGTVAFTSTDGDASLPSDFTFTGADNGTHTFSSGTTLTTAGSQTITATDTATSSITGTSTAIGVSPAPTSTFVVGLPSGAAAGTAVDMSVTAKDAYGNTTPAYSGTVAFTSTDAGAILPDDTAFEAGDHGHVAIASGVTFATAGDQTVTATDTVSSSVTGTSGPVDVGPAAADRLVVTTSASTSTAGDALDVTVTAEDGFGNTVPTFDGTVHFTSTDDQATLPADYTFVPGDDHGTHTFTGGVTYKTAGNRTTTATDTVASSMMGTSAMTAVSPAPASSVEVAAPSTVVSATPFDVTVTARDEFGNTTPSYAGTIAFTSTDPDASLAPAYTFTGADAGVHLFSGAFTLLGAGDRTITATDTTSSSITGTSDPIDVQRGAVSLSAAGLSFGTVTTGSSSEPQTLTVTNSGTAALSISALTIGGAGAAEFTASADTCSGTSLAVAASCSVHVTFSPSAAGEASATLSVAGDAADSPSVVTLSGTGEARPAPPTTPEPTPTETIPAPEPPAQPVAEERAVSDVVLGRIQVMVDGRFTALTPGQPVPYPATFRPIMAKGQSVPLVTVSVADARGDEQRLAMRSTNVFVLDQTAKATTVRLKGIKSCRHDDRTLGWIRVEGGAPLQVAGRNSTAVPKGPQPARWKTAERCDGTVTKVIRGAVVVHDARTNRRITVQAGERYLAATKPAAAA